MSVALMINLPGTYLYLALCLSLFILYRKFKKGRASNSKGLPLPPGPKGYLLLGNLFDMPVDKAWLVYDAWRKTYGKTFLTVVNTIQ